MLRNGTRGLVALALAVSMVGPACSEEDAEAPAAPRLDPAHSPTRIGRQLVSGSAEYNSTVSISRAPAFGAEEPVPVSLVADPYTAEFSFEVPLEVGENVFSFVATDEAGNASEPAQLTIVREEAKPVSLSLTLDRTLVLADQGRLEATAAIGSDDPGMPLAGFAITFTARDDAGAVEPVTATATTDARGVARARLEGLAAAGPWTLEAKADESPEALDTRPFLVAGGAPAAIDLVLVATVDGQEVRGAEISVPPDTEIRAEITVKDEPENVIAAPFELYTDAPGALIEGGKLTGIVAARGDRAYRVVATVPSTAAGLVLTRTALLTVVPGPATGLQLRLARAEAAAGEAVAATVRYFDAFDNEVLPGPSQLANPQLASDDAAAVVSLDPLEVRHDLAGEKQVTFRVDYDPGTGALPLADTGSLRIHPAGLDRVDLTLAGAGFDPASGDRVIEPDTSLAVTTVAYDAFDNVLPGIAVDLSTDSAGIFVPGAGGQLTLSGVTRAGGYRVIARASGTGVADLEDFTVEPAAAARIDLALSSPVTTAGASIEVSATAYDGFGNARPGDAISLTLNPTGTAVVPGPLVVDAAGSYTVDAALASDPAITASTPLEVLPASPASVDLVLAGTGFDPASGDRTIDPATELAITATVTDLFGNVIPGALVELTTDAGGLFGPGAAAPLALTGVTAAGSYRVVARLLGSGLSDQEPFTVEPGPAARLSLSLSAAIAAAGAAVDVSATVFDAHGNVRPGELVSITVNPGALVVAPGPLTLTTAGPYTLLASLAANPGVTAQVDLLVEPAGPATLALTLTPAIIQPGDVVQYATAVADAFGNPITGAPISVVTDAPGAVVAAGEIRGATRVGSYVVIAQVAGTNVSDTEPLTVGTGAAATIDLALGGLSVVTGSPLSYSYRVTDGAGNPIPGAAVTITTNAPVGGVAIDTLNRTITFSAEGTFTVTADGGLDATGAPIVDREAVSAFAAPDRTAPTVTIGGPAAGAVFAPGGVMTVLIAGDDDQSLGEIRLQLRGALFYDETRLVPTGVRNTTEVFQIPIPGGAFGQVQITGAVTDTSGNLVVSPRRTVQIDPAAGITVFGPAAGISTLTGGPGTLLNAPQGFALDGTGRLFIANDGDNRIILYDPATDTQTVYVSFVPGRARDLFFDGTRLFVSGGGRLYRVETNGSLTAYNAGASPLNPFGLASAGVNTLVVADQRVDQVMLFGTAAAPPTNQTFTAAFPSNAGGNLNAPWGVALSGVVLFVGNDGTDEIWRENTNTGATLLVAAGNPEVDRPRDLVLSPGGDLYWANRGNGTIYRLDLDGALNCVGACAPQLVAANLQNPVGLAFDAAGRLLVTDEGFSVVFRLTGVF